MDEGGRSEALDQFQAIYQAHYGAVLAYARRRTTDLVDAQDAVAEAFTVAWSRVDKLPPPESTLPWLYGVTRRVLANQRRGSRRRDDLSSRVGGQPHDDVDVEKEVVASDERRTVLAALWRLRQADREVLQLAVWEESSHREIAITLGCSESSVAVRVHRAKARLGREIEKEERRAAQGKGRAPKGRAEGHDR